MRQTKAELAKQAWRLLFDYLMATSPARTAALAQRNLTPNDARGLWSLDADDGRPIGTLAREWDCDPSNVTFIIDRLVRAGLAERRESETDRRVKRVRLTADGVRVKRDILDEYHVPPAEFTTLSGNDLKALTIIMNKLWLPPRGTHQ